MEFQKIMNFLDNIPNQPSKFKTKNWFEMNDKSRGTYNKDLKLCHNLRLCNILCHLLTA